MATHARVLKKYYTKGAKTGTPIRKMSRGFLVREKVLQKIPVRKRRTHQERLTTEVGCREIITLALSKNIIRKLEGLRGK